MVLSFALSYYACIVIATIYPGYKSFKALRTTDSKDDAQWLTYWVVFASFALFEGVAEPVVSWLPLYYECKFLFFMWLISPQTKGAALVYEKFLTPFLDKYEDTLDPVFSRADNVISYVPMQHAQTYVEKYGPDVAESIQKQATDMYNKYANSKSS